MKFLNIDDAFNNAWTSYLASSSDALHGRKLRSYLNLKLNATKLYLIVKGFAIFCALSKHKNPLRNLETFCCSCYYYCSPLFSIWRTYILYNSAELEHHRVTALLREIEKFINPEKKPLQVGSRSTLLDIGCETSVQWIHIQSRKVYFFMLFVKSRRRASLAMSWFLETMDLNLMPPYA